MDRVSGGLRLGIRERDEALTRLNNLGRRANEEVDDGRNIGKSSNFPDVWKLFEPSR